MRLFPGANQEEIRAFREYIERQVTTNRDLMERLLRARHFQKAFRIQVEYFQSQLRTAAEEATQIGAWMVGLANSPMLFLVSRHPPSLRKKTRQRAFLTQQALPFPLAPAPTSSTPQQTPARKAARVCSVRERNDVNKR